MATVLSNQRPPYSIAGGMFDVLSESRGEMFAVRNEEALAAMKLFETCEGIDIDPAAGVALAALQSVAGSGQISPETTVLLHITGGGASRRASEKVLIPAQPDLELPLNEVGAGAALDRAWGLFEQQTTAHICASSAPQKTIGGCAVR